MKNLSKCLEVKLKVAWITCQTGGRYIYIEEQAVQLGLCIYTYIGIGPGVVAVFHI